MPVGQWLNELRFRCEPECMTALQSKAIATSEDMCRLSTIVCTDSEVVRDLYQRTKVISDEFKKVYKYVLIIFFFVKIYQCYIIYIKLPTPK